MGSSLPADPSLHSLAGELSDVMENSVVSLHPNNSSHDADSEGEEPREEIKLPPPAAAAGRRKTERREVDVGSLEDETNSLHHLTRKLCWMFLLAEEKGEMVVAMPRAHPGVRVQVEVNRAMYEKTGLPLRMGKSSMTRKGKLLQIPKIELLCDTGAQVDCINRKKLHALGLVENHLLSPEVVVGCANESPAGVMGVFFGR